MDWQIYPTCGVIGLAAVFIAWRGWRAWRGTKSSGCTGGCGCAKSSAPSETNGKPTLIAPEQLVLRRRP